MCHGETRRVVHTIANHRHTILTFAQRFYRCDFFLRLQLGANFIKMQLAFQMLCGCETITGEYRGAQTAGFQFVDDAPRLRADVVTQLLAVTIPDPLA